MMPSSVRRRAVALALPAAFALLPAAAGATTKGLTPIVTPDLQEAGQLT